MNVVLYTTDLEPITVIDLPLWALDMLRHERRVRIPVPCRLKSPVLSSMSLTADIAELPTCEIWGESIQRGNKRGLLVFASDEVRAMALQAATLPGQRYEWEQQFRRGFADAIIRAIGGYRRSA